MAFFGSIILAALPAIIVSACGDDDDDDDNSTQGNDTSGDDDATGDDDVTADDDDDVTADDDDDVTGDDDGMPNPASEKCEEDGYTLEIREDETGGQYGVCIFGDGTECEEWDYYRGECAPGDCVIAEDCTAVGDDDNDATEDGSCHEIDIYCNFDGDCCEGGFCDVDGYCSPVPDDDDASIDDDATIDDDLTGDDDAGIPNPASEKCEEDGYTLEMREDENGGQYGVCIFGDGTECEEWSYFRGECAPGDCEVWEECDIVGPGGKAVLIEAAFGECSDATNAPPEGVIVTVNGNVIAVDDLVDENCCALLSVDFEEAGENLVFTELSDPEAPPCDCMCQFPMHAEVQVEPGAYLVQVFGFFGGEPKYEEAVTVE
jgi:putative hemolysin